MNFLKRQVSSPSPEFPKFDIRKIVGQKWYTMPLYYCLVRLEALLVREKRIVEGVGNRDVRRHVEVTAITENSKPAIPT